MTSLPNENTRQEVFSIKFCTRCGTGKSLDNFHKNKGSYDGLTSLCKTCCSVYRQKRYIEKREVILNANKKWREENREYFYAYCNKWRKEHKEIVNIWNLNRYSLLKANGGRL